MASRVRNASRNIVWGFANKVLTLLLPFVTRTVLIYTLGVEYVGLSSLFTSLLGVLSLAELGVGSALVYMMYKPVAAGDDEAVCALLGLYRKWYRIIGIVILLIGLALVPVLRFLVSGDCPDDVNLYALYGIYLVNTVLSYFLFAYKQSAFVATQRNDYVSNVGSVLAMASSCMQILALLVVGSYYAFVAVLPVITLCQNLAIAYLFKKKFPNWLPSGSVPKEDLETIKGNILGLLIQKIGSVILDSVDSIVISAFLGLSVLGIYNNYYMIVAAVMGFMGIVCSNLIPSVGNSIATESADKNYADFRKFDFMYTWIAAWFGSCILVLTQPFVTLWVGTENTLPFEMVVLLAVVFYTHKMSDMTYVYRDAAGLWREGRFVPLAAGLVNLGLNLLTIGTWGLVGVAVSTIASLVFVYLPFYTRILFKAYFNDLKKWTSYLMRQCVRIVCFCAIGAACYLAVSFIPFEGVLGLALSFAVMLVLPNLLLGLLYCQTADFKAAKAFAAGFVNSRIKRN